MYFMSDSSSSNRLLSALKRRVRFRIRTLLVSIALVSLWFGYFFNRMHNERRAAEAISAASGTMVYDWQIRPSGSDPKVELKRPGPE